MKTWRIGSFSMGVFLVLLGVTLFLGQIHPATSALMLRNWWPFLLIALGVEILVSHSLRFKWDGPIRYDFLSILFIALVGFLSLGFVALQTVGVLDQIQRVTSGKTFPVEHILTLAPEGKVGKVIMDTGHGGWIPVRVWDSTDGQVRAKVRGRVYTQEKPTRPEEELEGFVTLEQINQVIYIRIQGPTQEPPWRPRPDQIDLFIPVGMTLESDHGDLKTSEFHGKLIGPEKNKPREQRVETAE